MPSPALADWQGLSEEQWHQLFLLAGRQSILSLFAHRLQSKGLYSLIPEDIQEKVKADLIQNTVRNLQHYHELHNLLDELNRRDIPVILLKGIYLADAVYEEIGVRPMGDIDLLCHPKDLNQIAAVLETQGYKALSPIIMENLLRTSKHLPRIVKKGGTNYEIHWDIVSADRPYRIDIDEFWKSSVSVTVMGHDAARAFCPEDLIQHLCVHISYQHQFNFGLRPFCDIAHSIRHFRNEIDWAKLVQRSKARNWEKGVYLALRLTEELLHPGIPAEGLDALTPESFQESMYQTARAQVLADKSFGCAIPVNFASLLEKKGLRPKLKIFWNRVFLPRETMATMYAVPMRSWKLNLYYIVRLRDVLRRHWHTFRHFDEKGETASSFAERSILLDEWLAD
jgi:hypothetical protein